MKSWVSKQRKQMNKTRMTSYTFSGGNGHHAQACGSTSLGWGSYGSMEMEERECGWLERKRCLKASMGSITVGKGEVF